MKLWEAEHPYYMTEGNYFSNDCHTKWESLDLFLEDFGEADVDRNLIVRWDWLEGGGWELPDYKGDDAERFAVLMIQMVQQRKAKLISHAVNVCRNDEPAARAFLHKHVDRLRENWVPITTTHGETP